MGIVRKLLTPDEVAAANTRYDSDCDCVQVTTDGGTTWTDAPGLNPRSQPAYRLPARGGADPRCDAAANMQDKLKSFVAQDVAGLAQFQLATALIGIVLIFLPEAGIIFDLFIAVAEAIITIGADAIEGAFTDAQWAIVLCILYCDIGSDGTVSSSQLSTIISDIETQCDSVVYDVLSLHLQMIGEVGLTNAGASGDVTGDCSSCECAWCYTIDFTVSDGGFTPAAWGGSPAAAWTSGVGWHDNGGFGPVKGVFIQFAASEVISYTSAEIFWTDASSMQTVNVQGFIDPAGAPTYNLFVDIFGAASGDQVVGAEPTQYIQLSLDNSAGGTGAVTLWKAILRGTGDNPFGTSNC